MRSEFREPSNLVVSITPLALRRDSRTFKQAASVARLGYRSLQLKLDVAHATKNAISTGRGDTRVHLQAIYAFL